MTCSAIARGQVRHLPRAHQARRVGDLGFWSAQCIYRMACGLHNVWSVYPPPPPPRSHALPALSSCSLCSPSPFFRPHIRIPLCPAGRRRRAGGCSCWRATTRCTLPPPPFVPPPPSHPSLPCRPSAEGRELIVLACYHTLHDKCWAGWTEEKADRQGAKASCPTCKQAVTLF